MAARSVLVTGGTGDIGRAIVAELARAGAAVSFQYFQNHETAEEIHNVSGTRPICVDFKRLGEFRLETEVDALVLAHGINDARGLVHEISDKEWNDALAINLGGSFGLVRQVLPGMVERRWGRIVAINSIYGLRGSRHNLPYNVSKHALSGLIKTIALEYGLYGVSANEICPGPVESSLLVRVCEERAIQERVGIDEYVTGLRRRIPTEELVQTSTIARLVSHLIAEPRADINGASFVVDGGLTC